MYCIRCGQQLPEKLKFCTHCGRAVERPPLKPPAIGFGTPPTSTSTTPPAGISAETSTVAEVSSEAAPLPGVAAGQVGSTMPSVGIPEAGSAAASGSTSESPSDSSDPGPESALLAALVGDLAIPSGSTANTPRSSPSVPPSRAGATDFDQAIQAGSASIAKLLLELRSRHSRKGHAANTWRVVLYSSFGAAGGGLFWRAFIRPLAPGEKLPESWLLWVLGIAMLAFVTNDLIEPYLIRRRGGQWTRQYHHEIRLGVVSVRGTLGFVLIAVGAEIYKSMALSDPDAAFYWLTIVLITGAMTYGWLRGVAQVPPLTTFDGRLAGAIAAGVVGILNVIFALIVRPSGSQMDLGYMFGFIAGLVLSWTISGHLGGWAIDKLSKQSLLVRFWAGAALSLIPQGLWTAWQVSIGNIKTNVTSASAIIHMILMTAGWCVGLWLCPPSEAVAQKLPANAVPASS